jgi:hypothetical protein
MLKENKMTEEEKQHWAEFEEKNNALQAELQDVFKRMEELAIEYKTGVSIDGPAYGMGGYFESTVDVDKDSDEYWEPDYCEKREDGKGYWQASSHSC